MSASPSGSQTSGEPQRIGPYEIGREIGKGSFAVVHRGLSRVPSTSPGTARRGAQDVAIKIVNRRKLTAKLLENLEGEISIMRTIRHVHVVELLDCLSTEDRIFLVMPFCASGDLSHYIRNAPKSALEAAAKHGGGSSSSTSNSRHEYRHWEDGGLNEVVVRSFLQQLASAMEFMRDRNIVHRDIKPQNLLLQPPDDSLIAAGHRPGIPQLKVADFGFARNLPTATLAETLCGSPLYMAPEILRYEKYDAKADLWSVGAVLYEMSVGKPPFRAQNHVELLRKIERGEDRIRFPDERSDGSLAREQARREEMGEKGEVKKAHTVADDIKGLIRGLLKSKPMERMSFDGLFRCSVVEDVRADELVRARQIAAAAAAAQAISASPRSSPRPAEKPLPAVEAAPTPAAATIRPSPQPAAPAPVVAAATPPPPPPPAVQRGFTSRYVVGGSSAAPTSAASPAAMAAPPTPAPLPALARDPERVRRASAARRLSAQEAVTAQNADEQALETSASSVTQLATATATGSVARRGSEQSSSGAATPSGGADEDSILGREYVMVEKRNVEVNALADELAAGGAARGNVASSPPAASLARRPSRLSRLGSGLAAQLSTPGPAPASPGNVAQARAGSFAAPPSPVRLGSTPPSGTPFALPAGVARRSSFVRRSSLSGSSSPRPKVITAVAPGNEEAVASSPSTSPLAEDARSSSALARAMPVPRSSVGGYDSPRTSAIAASPSPPAGAVGSTTYPSTVTATTPSAPWTAGPTSSALARAISMASVRLFGVPSGMSLRGAAALVRNRSSRRAALIRSGEYPDGAEAGLIVTLEDLGQKSFVLSEFADARLAAYFPSGPHQAGSGSPEADQASLSPSSGGGLVSGSLGRSQGMAFGRPSSGIRRTSSSNSSSTSGLMHDAHTSPQQHQVSTLASATNATPAEIAAAEALLLYVKSLSFLQRGIDATKAFLEARSRPNAPAVASADVNDLGQWLRARFNDGYDRADFARSKCGEIPEAAQHVDKLIFDKALEIARGAALDELENNRVGVAWDANKCLLAYETASSMLTALLDPGEDAMDMSDGAAATIEKFLRSIDKRLQALQRRVGE